MVRLAIPIRINFEYSYIIVVSQKFNIKKYIINYNNYF
jgi:hypothetical protein